MLAKHSVEKWRFDGIDPSCRPIDWLYRASDDTCTLSQVTGTRNSRTGDPGPLDTRVPCAAVDLLFGAAAYCKGYDNR